MFGNLFARDGETRRMASRLYGAIVAQARSRALYADLGVPDTVSGRFEMVVLHAVLVLERLRAGGDAEGLVGQAVFDLFCADMDRSLRELGVGDLALPRRMKQMAESFYGRAEAYGRCLADGDTRGLAEAFDRNVGGGAPGNSRSLATYAVAAAAGLAETRDGVLLEARPAFPDPAAFALVPTGQ
ncbi:MAG: ubiquinol-cytochrome C chaperone family protein [Bauldia sp.]